MSTNFADLSDEKVVSLVLEGDLEKYAEIVERYQDKILRYLNRLLNYNQQDAEDTTSETLLKAYLNLASFNSKLRFSSWLYRIAHNEAVNLIKKKSKAYTVDIDEYENHFATDDNQQPNRKDLEQTLSHLSVEDRNILALFHFEEKTLKEMSDILKITENHVAVKLKRARVRAKKFTKIDY